MKRIMATLLMLATLGAGAWWPSSAAAGQPTAQKKFYLPVVNRSGVQAPTLKWQKGGCTSWCQTGWYSSPALADVNNDGRLDIVASAYSLWELDGLTGGIIHSVIQNSNR